MTEALEGIPVFVAVAQEGGFRAAGKRLGVTGSAVSHALRRLEERLGVTLVRRTTRSVHLTEAGERFYAAVRPALEDLSAAVAEIGELVGEPGGLLRLHVAVSAESFLAGPVLADFLAAHPRVQLQLAVSDARPDIVAGGYDAGIEPGEVIDQDMVAVPVTGKMRLAVVGAPAYFARHPAPEHPSDLTGHACINWHATPDAPPYRWEFTENGRDFSVAVEARVLCTDGAVNLHLARAGLGLTIAYTGQVAEDVARGTLVSVLEEFLPPFDGCYLYYPNRRHTSPALRALIDYLLRLRQSQPIPA
jgi:DNA-binding transcriptional LysR family regulator